MAQPSGVSESNGDVADALRSLLQAGLDLGVAEAARRLAQLMPAGPERDRGVESETAINETMIRDLIIAIREDSAGVFQLVKEVWSRGETKDRKIAARAVGKSLSKIAPHRSLGLSRDLATMARNPKEADIVGTEAIGPLLESNPPMFDRVKQFLKDNQVWVRRAAIAGLVAYVTRQKKVAGLALTAILSFVEANEKEIKASVRWAVKEISRVDWRATAAAITEWARSDPTRIKLAKQYAAATAEGVRKNVEKAVFTNLAKFATAAPAMA